MSEIIQEIKANMARGRAKQVQELVRQAVDEGVAPQVILDEGLLAAMNEVGVKFKNNEMFVPEVLVAARAMNMGIEILKPLLGAEGMASKGVAIIGTVKGDLHDIGKNLVKMMIEGKGIKVVDIGVDVPAEAFYEAAMEHDADIICCSALLTTTMSQFQTIVDYMSEKGVRDKFKIMIGGAPVTQAYCDTVGADCYTPDAASAAEAALAFCTAAS